MKFLLFIFLCIVAFTLLTESAYGQANGFVNPNGIFEYDGKTLKKDGEIYGYFGTIKVLQLDSNKILVSFSRPLGVFSSTTK